MSYASGGVPRFHSNSPSLGASSGPRGATLSDMPHTNLNGGHQPMPQSTSQHFNGSANSSTCYPSMELWGGNMLVNSFFSMDSEPTLDDEKNMRHRKKRVNKRQLLRNRNKSTRSPENALLLQITEIVNTLNLSLAKNSLQELCQLRRWELPKYELKHLGPQHDLKWMAQVVLGNIVATSKSWVKTKKEAEKIAAFTALKQIVDETNMQQLTPFEQQYTPFDGDTFTDGSQSPNPNSAAAAAPAAPQRPYHFQAPHPNFRHPHMQQTLPDHHPHMQQFPLDSASLSSTPFSSGFTSANPSFSPCSGTSLSPQTEFRNLDIRERQPNQFYDYSTTVGSSFSPNSSHSPKELHRELPRNQTSSTVDENLNDEITEAHRKLLQATQTNDSTGNSWSTLNLCTKANPVLVDDAPLSSMLSSVSLEPNPNRPSDLQSDGATLGTSNLIQILLESALGPSGAPDEVNSTSLGHEKGASTKSPTAE